MQESVVDEREAKRAVSNWFLSRDGQQHGPLTDRELSLFAESGNFKHGDLLWTEGLDAWKPADAIFGPASSREEKQKVADAGDEAASAEAPGGGSAASNVTLTREVAEVGDTGDIAFCDTSAAAPEPAEPGTRLHPGAALLAQSIEAEAPEVADPESEHVGALVQALKGETEPPKFGSKEWIIAELKQFSGTCGYLCTIFALLALHAWVSEARYGVTFGFFVLATINAFWLMKLMPLAEEFGPFRDLKHRPLIYSILYRTFAFVTLLFAAYATEMMIFSSLGGGRFDPGFADLAGGIAGTLALWLIFCVALLPYFAFKELERAVGADMIAKLLLGVR